MAFILCGRQASDTDAGQVGSGIAEILDIPSITVAQKMEAGDGKVRVERVVSDGYEVIEAPMPVLITTSSEIGELRTWASSLTRQEHPTCIIRLRRLSINQFN